MSNDAASDSRSRFPLPAGSSRRSFLRASLLGGFAVSLGIRAGDLLMSPDSAFAKTKLTPDEALKELVDGNGRFASGKLTAHEHDLSILKQKLVSNQEPFASVLTCADSRIPVEMVFDQTIGRLFVTRVAGNMITPEIIGSLEFGAAVLGTKVILVLGHSDCGAVKAAIANKTVPGQISSLYPHLQPAVDRGNRDLKVTTRANARIQARLLAESSTVVAGLVKEGQLKVVAGYYDIGSGEVTLLED